LFRPDEVAADAPVVIVDEKLAALAWPGQRPIGKLVQAGDAPPREIVGVVPHERRILSRTQPALAYLPRPHVDGRNLIVVWAPGIDADDLAARLAAPLAAIRGYRGTVRAVTFDGMFARDAGEAQFQQPIVVAFGLFSLAVAGVGLFGLVAYLVEQRTRDFGVRLALGARPAHIWRQVVADSVTPAVLGLGIGLAVAWALERVVRASVFGWESSGPAAAAIVAAALLGVAVLAAVGPARRAMRIDPVRTLRAE
jgi:hypothetical protein